MDRGIHRSSGRLDRSLRELPQSDRPTNTEANLGLAKTSAQGLSHEVIEGYNARLVARGIQISEIVSNYVDCCGVRSKR
ncbi:hypothetical protein F183_A43460 [Bryobacterales bacterium F-183]|nr:hypothetical protein F183_A43460 [Bryobacterales bacterium F-183]